MPSGPAGRDDHEIGEGRFALQVDEGQVFGLVIFEGFGKRLRKGADVGNRGILWGLNPVLGG
ncbi:MAG: hypothetical protein ACK4HR_09205 [Hyphomonas sp.]